MIYPTTSKAMNFMHRINRPIYYAQSVNLS
jgi:hypothetical protein